MRSSTHDPLDFMEIGPSPTPECTSFKKPESITPVVIDLWTGAAVDKITFRIRCVWGG
ncbi:hypothetical protein MILUP08_45757 [Micromonospora lupini str. Lupac 08]|uniref:Uncharacterized protein n=1 Tax=Micromonospora lupini str. Lupac 08 TaxID=1150864 RepID=I0LAL7_9ACTN|nr:hypothetical protein MILUP08_45757 [Micromonospora lupini str. Lupac 08]